jgi:hypothetical protein
MSDTTTIQAYPLQWPIGWFRKAGGRSRAKFGRGYGTDMTSARNLLFAELRRLGAGNVVVSTNLPLNSNGLPRGDAREPGDAGVAVYFRLKGDSRALACDKWDRVADNIMAIAKHVEAVRGQIRWGVGTIEQAFGGYKLLTAGEASKTWWEILGVAMSAMLSEVTRARDELLKKHHPDHGGSHAIAAEINAAYDEALRALKS